MFLMNIEWWAWLLNVALSHLSITESHDHHASIIFTIKTSNCQQTRTIFASQDSQRQQESVGVSNWKANRKMYLCLCETAGSDQRAGVSNIAQVHTFKLVTYSLVACCTSAQALLLMQTHKYTGMCALGFYHVHVSAYVRILWLAKLMSSDVFLDVCAVANVDLLQLQYKYIQKIINGQMILN